MGAAVPPPVGERIPEAWETDEYCRGREGPIIKIPTYKGLKRDDTVFISDKYWPQFHRMAFKFLCYAHNMDSGIGWIEVFGGPKGKEWVRAFPVHSLRVPARR